MFRQNEVSIAVVVPTVGRWSELERCLSSLEHQADGPPEKCICVLSGHTDALPQNSMRPWIHVVREPRRSPGAARNAGLAIADTDWVAFIDDDCIAPPTWLRTLTRVVLERPGMAIAGGAVIEPDRPGTVYQLMRMLNYMRSPTTLKWRGDGVPSLGGANLLMRRSIACQVGGFNAGLTSTEDFELVLRLHRAGEEIVPFHHADPVVHIHTTGIVTFVKRYRRYGEGVARVVALHDLDPAAHRVYCGHAGRSLASAVRRFAREDLVWMRGNGSNLNLRHRILVYVRAASWQGGAWWTVRQAGRG